MRHEVAAAATAADAEIGVLIARLVDASEKLKSLTHGEVDTVAGPEGRAFLLHDAQSYLREREVAKNAAILDSLPANIALLDSDGVIVSVNEAWRSFAGANAMHAAKAGLGQNYLGICDRATGADSEEAASAARAIRSVLSCASSSATLEYPCHSPNEERWFRMAVTPVGQTMPRGAVVMHLDISVRHRAEVALAELSLTTARREQVLSATLASMEDFAYVFDRNARFVFGNRPLLAMFGVTLEQLVGKDYRDLGFPEALFQKRAAQIEHVFRTGETITDESELVDRDGFSGCYEHIVGPVRSAAGVVELVVGTSRNITERKLAARAVTRTQNHLRGLIDGLGPSIFVALLTPAGILLEMNKAPLAIAGLAQVDVLGMPFADTPWWAQSRAAQAQLRDAIERAASGDASRYDVQMAGAGNATIDVDFSLQPLRDDHGAVAFLVASASVISERKRAEAALQVSVAEQRESGRLLSIERSRLVEAQRVAKIGSWETTLATMGVIWSAETHRIFETDPTGPAPTHASFLERVHPLDRERLDREFSDSLASHEPQVTVHRILLSGNRTKYIEARWQVVFDEQGVARRVVGTSQDVTEHKLAELRIQRLNRGYMVLSQINALIVRAKSREELFTESCRIAVEAGRFPMAWIGVVEPARSRVVPVASAGADVDLLSEVGVRLSLADDAPLGHGPSAVAVREERVVVVNDIATDPGIRHAQVHVDRGIRSLVSLPLVVAGKVVAVLGLHAPEVDYFDEAELELLRKLANDIAFAIDHIGQAEQLDYLAYYDALTGLANRNLFVERARQCLRSAGNAGNGAALVLLDLERFKGFNDSLGQEAGDELLRMVGAWLTENLSDPSLLARVGADIFALMLVDAPQPGDAARRLERLIQAFHDHPFTLASGAFRIAGKFGIAMFPEDAVEAGALFLKAESALKNAKSGGHRQLFYTQKMTDSVARRLALETRLRNALDNNEFVLHYQPKVELRSGRVCGAEALIRWNDPCAGMVPPIQFIPILEETGLIQVVGRWAMRQALRDHLRWRDAGFRAPRIAVNVSPLQLRDPAFVPDIASLLSAHEFAAQGLELEITESMIMADVEQSITTLQALRALEVGVAIDDFGTGFSSLGYLSKLPVDSLKIDRSFVADMTMSPEGLSLVSTIITLAHSLHLKVVAEGVETEEQLGLLKLLRCDEMQGYLYSKAVAADEFETRFLVR